MIDQLVLARAQFGLNISFHILFPTITIALGWLLVFFKWRYNRTAEPRWMLLYRLWVKVFALSFALGVVSGITMSFQFGTNWPGYMQTVGNVAGPLLAYEVLTAFFLEATFLGVMLFGYDRVSNRVHTLATWLVALGTSLSAFWILVLNSWMHTPAGYELVEGVVHATDWSAIIFNPSMPYRLAHMLLASVLTCAFLVAGLSAYRYLRQDSSPGVRTGMRVGIIMAAVAVPLQILVGDLHGLNTLEHQPEKIAAMEGIWETEQGADLRLFAIVDEQTRSNSYEIRVPKLASLILTHDREGVIVGLNDFEHHPPVAALFYSFRIMVGIGLLMLLTALIGLYRIIRRRSAGRAYARLLLCMTFSGWVATLAGWYTTEIGRQPWLVNGVLMTEQAVSDVAPSLVLTTLVLYLLVYIGLIFAYMATVFYLARKAALDDESSFPDPAVGTRPGVAASQKIITESR